MRIKVCILQNGLARGGTDTFVVNLCKGLNSNKYDITVINPSNKKESLVREPEVLQTGARIIHTSPLNRGLISKIRHLVMLYQILKKEKYDVFQTNIDLFNGPQLFVAWLAGVPVRCCHSHNSMQQRALVSGMTFSIRVYQYIMKWMCWTFSNRRLGCSEAAMDFLFTGKKWWQSKYPVIISNGIDIKNFRMPIDVNKKKEEIGIKAKYNIVTIGRIIPQKNPIFIVEVFSELCKTRNDVDLVWIGIGDKENKCREILKSNGVLGRVHFLGSRTDVNEILPCCDLFFLPSAFEGLGIVVIEAQAAGLKCLVSDVVPRETNCGIVNYLSLSCSKQEWVQTISDMLDGKCSLVLDEDRIQKYSIQFMAEQMEKVFDN